MKTMTLTLLASVILLSPLACGGGGKNQNQNANQNNNNSALPRCGDGQVDPGEECDEGPDNSDLAPDACRTNCRLPHCGDGVVDDGEACDGADLGGGTCQSEGFSHGILGCDAPSCSYDTAECVPCPEGFSSCSETCVHLPSDPRHCGACGEGCEGGAVCVAGGCVAAAEPWESLGDPVELGAEYLSDVSLVEVNDTAALGYIKTVNYGTGSTSEIHVWRWDDTFDDWYLHGSIQSLYEYNLHGMAVSLATDSTYLYTALPASLAPHHGNVHVVRGLHPPANASWGPFATPGRSSGGAGHSVLDLQVVGDTLHLVTQNMGSGICVDYAWWTHATGWQQHQSTTGSPGGLTSESRGRPALAVTDRAWVAYSEYSEDTCTLRVVAWDDEASQWASPWPALATITPCASGYDMALVTERDGTLLVAWVEASAPGLVGDTLFVARLNPFDESVTPLGTGPVDPAAEAEQPSLALYGDTPWVTYVDRGGSGGHGLRVRAFDGEGDWLPAGGSLNVDPDKNAERPVIAIVQGVPTVAWIEGNTDVHVKTIPASE